MEIKDINLEEYEISEQKDKEIIVLKKKKSKFPTWEGLGNISGVVFIGRDQNFLKLQVYLHLIAVEIYSLLKNMQNQHWQWLRFHN